jgi:hypothetical protein
LKAFHNAILLINQQTKAIKKPIKPKPARIAAKPSAAAAFSSSVAN